MRRAVQADCSDGEFFNSGNCLPCQSGQRCTGGNTVSCGFGEYSGMSQTTCDICANLPNKVCTSNSQGFAHEYLQKYEIHERKRVN